MSRNLLGRFLFLLFVLAWSLWETYPPQARNLIDVFNEQASNRDTNFTAIVQQAQKLQQANPQRTYANLVEAVGTNDLTRYFPGIKLKDEANPNRAILLQLQRSSAGRIKLGLDLQGGTSLLVALDTSKLNTNQLSQADQKELAISQALEVLRRRVDRLGVTEPILTPVDDDRIEIQLPGLSEAEKETARNTIKKVAFLEFRLVHERSSEQLASGLIDPGYEVKTIKQRTGRADQQEVQRYVVKRKAEQGLTGNYIVRAGVEPDPLTNEPHVTMKFNSEGAILFEKITTENVGRQLAIVLDGELYSAPVIRGPIGGGNAVIEGRFTVKEAYELAYVLENPLQVPVSILQEYSVEPSLGKDSIESGIRASLIGTILVSAFMLVYYLFAGLVANVALLLNVIILIGVMCSIDTTLTLPGIAGIVLTIGMAIDANVLIYERIREELRLGKTVRAAISAGYSRAMISILDSNLTTLLAAVFLFQFGTGPVKGFAVTLSIGILASLFTALFVSRFIFDYALATRRMQTLSI